MQRSCVLWAGVMLLAACAHHPVPADCKTHLERINPVSGEPQKDAMKSGEQAKEDTP